MMIDDVKITIKSKEWSWPGHMRKADGQQK